MSIKHGTIHLAPLFVVVFTALLIIWLHTKKGLLSFLILLVFLFFLLVDLLYHV